MLNRPAGTLAKVLADAPADTAPFLLINALSKAGAPLNERDFEGRTPLSMAIRNQTYELVPILLKAGADPKVDTVQTYGEHKSVPILLLTLQSAVDVEVFKTRNPNEKKIPAAFDPTMLVKQLLEARAKPDAKDADGMSAFHYWAIYDSCPLVLGEILLAAGVPMDELDSTGYTPLGWALTYERGRYDEANRTNNALNRLKLPGNQPDADKVVPASPAQLAKGYAERIEFLLQHGANPDLLTKGGKTIRSFATPQRRLAITRQRLYPKLAEDAAINLYWTDSGATHRIVVAPQKSDAPPLLAEALTHWSESFKDDTWKPDALQRLSIWRKTEAGPLEEIPLKPDATELPALHWGDVLEVTNLSEAHQQQEAKGLPLLRQMFRHLVRKVTVKLGDLSQEITLRGSLAVYDPTRPEAPLMAMTPLLNVIGGAIPEYRAGTVSLQHTGPGGPGQEVRWPTKEERKLLPEDGDIISLTAEKDEKKVVMERARCITVTSPGRLASLRVERIDLPPTLLQLLAEVYAAPADDYTQNQIAKLSTSDQIAAVLLRQHASPVPCQFAWPDWSAIKIHRWDAEGKPLIVPVNLAAGMAGITATTSAEEARKLDVPLDVGDIVELPLLTPDKAWSGLDDKTILLLTKALSGAISLVDESGRIRAMEMKWVPTRFVATTAGLVPLPASKLAEGEVNSVRVGTAISSWAKDQRFDWLERGTESYQNSSLSNPFALPGDIVHTTLKSGPSVVGKQPSRPMPALPPNAPMPRKRIVTNPDGSLPAEAVAPTGGPKQQTEPDRKRTVLPASPAQ